MRSFITGSFAYGKPTSESDIDLVVLVSPHNLHQLQNMADKVKGWQEGTKNGLKQEAPSNGGPEADSLRFGKLNLIAVTWDRAFETWKKGTDELIKRRDSEHRDITREEAVKLFKELRTKLAEEELQTKGEEDL